MRCAIFGATDRTGPFAFTGDLKYKRQNENASLGALRGSTEERVFRDSTEAKMLAKADGSGREEPSRRALAMEKSQASWPPLGAPRDPDVSWAPRGGGRIGQVWIRGAIVVNGVSWDQEARLFQDCSKVGSVICSRMNHVSHQIVASDPIAAASANQGVVSPFCP